MLRLIALGLILVVVVGLAALGLSSRRERSGGWLERRMAPCGGDPNCVGSLAAGDAQRVEPLVATGDAKATFRRAAEIVESLPKTRVVVDEPDYLHAECASRLFGFVDDLELWLDGEAGVIHVRSASRVGKSDLGANRRRVERLREALAASRDGG